ncbi:MAG: HAD family phosphatase [Clostridia bacterium]|nr:HAD family phosphatase [Clostridia bacterium]
MLPEAVIFDMDGLMFDTERLSSQAWQAAGKRMGVDLNESVISRFRGTTPQVSRRVCLEAFGPSFDYTAARTLRTEFLEQAIRERGLPVKPGLKDLLSRLSEEGIPAAVASSSPLETIRWYLSLAEITPFFQAIVSGEEAARSKPDPDCFLLAASRLKKPAASCLVLEDSENGLLAAQAAGMRSICIPDLAMPAPEILARTEAVLPSLSEVWPWLQHASSDHR